MSVEDLKNRIPEYAKDIKLNLSSLAGEETLNSQQLWGTFLSCALAGGHAEVIRAIHAEASAKLSPEALNASKAAASIMAMNNVYYKFTGMMDETYRSLPAKLRMNVIGNPGVEKADFELWSLAVSAINGCQFCVKSHEKKVRAEGFSAEQVQTAVRIAATVSAVSAVLRGEDALSGDQIAKAA
ncbi:MAG: carboxymuconolactone decarboxylase family protein [Alphaproteobacteria bacterium]|nr:carboxymuconolactone decarboxylase family protein [Leptospiraceae bacterium]MCB1592833.1 carboxymuconolactone decarboxylase family protein [Alphaproteobacteria bacterium]MCB1682060.1 carboxymuconolactone decarboxylase family protein [Alphaproteobacteria bacterium]MCB9975730.1 carboxymuconolactone decarboxylase family protein [Rhodospirillales bacterium]